MVEIRKIIAMREVILSELGVAAPRPVVRAVGMAVIGNPFAGRLVDDLQLLFEAGAMLGERLMPELVKLLDGPAVSYGKGALVGVNGEMEHGGACIHPDAGQADAGRDRRWQGRDIFQRQGRIGGRQPRCAARSRGRLLVIPAFRHDNGVGL
jgi:hypothetical protein